MHPADTHIVRRQRSVEISDSAEWADRLGHVLHAAGVPEEEMAALSDDRNRMVFAEPVLPDREITDDELADVPGQQVRAVWTPGHSPGHTCFHLEERDLLLAGDHLLPGITPHVGLYETDRYDQDALGDFLTSLDRIAKLNPAEVLPAHQYRFADAAGRTREIVRHHEQRLADLLTRLEGEPLTPWQIAEGMEWNRRWEQIPPVMRQVALSEAAAHLRHLLHLGRAEMVPAPRSGSPPLPARTDGASTTTVAKKK